MLRGKALNRTDVALGEDWVAEGAVDSELRAGRERRSFLSLNRSPLARKIITYNLLAMVVLVAGVLYLNPFRNSLVTQRETGLVSEARLISNVLESAVAGQPEVNFATGTGIDLATMTKTIKVPDGVEMMIFDQNGQLVSSTVGSEKYSPEPIEGMDDGARSTFITDFLNRTWSGMAELLAPENAPDVTPHPEDQAQILVGSALLGKTLVNTDHMPNGDTIFTVATPIRHSGQVIGVLATSSFAGEINRLVRLEREQVLQMFVVAIIVSIGLSLVLASTIANPLSDLAAAAELGRDKNARKISPSRIRIPDLTARPDEIGRLSGAMRGMVAALYERIESNEQFAADVAHEIKNPLASLRSAVGTLRVAKRDDQRDKLLDVIDHDVRRLDRLVSDISNASRLDSELVREEEENFNLLKMLGNITDYLGQDAKSKGVEFIADLPADPIMIQGLEARLAQVFVNLITNAVSFCGEGDAVRVWARQRDSRVLIVVEDTGPGIPDQALTKIFKRFYSERPPGQFGEHSGLGLAISKQIVEAHGGVIWAENIRPTDVDPTSEPLGARFVVGLPI